MKPLPATFEGRGDQRGFTFQQVIREGNVAIFQKTKPGTSVRTFELIKIRQNKARTMGGAFIPPMESYPHSGSWGEMGWSYPDLETAQTHFLSLRERQNNGSEKETI